MLLAKNDLRPRPDLDEKAIVLFPGPLVNVLVKDNAPAGQGLTVRDHDLAHV
jgi:hypothetical protein